MTTDQLARSYLRKCRDRLAALEVLIARGAFSDVVRESQEIVELASKGILRYAGIDPPKIHDVGALLREHAALFPTVPSSEMERLAVASARLRKEREFSFYGDIDFIPTDAYTDSDAEWAAREARFAVDLLAKLLEGVCRS